MNITDYFDSYFEIVPADTDELLEEVLKLRYQVYCVETTILRKSHHTDCREYDPYDSHSAHCLIQHKLTGIFVASVRLILPNSCDNTSYTFPIEEHCGECFYKDIDILKKIPRDSLAEISRFLISKERERKIREAASHSYNNAGTTSYYHRKDGLLCYLLLFGLVACLVRLTTENNISFLYAGLETSFHRLLKKFAIEFTPIGPLFEYHGKRLPCLGSTESILSGIHAYRPDLWNFLTNGYRPIHLEHQENSQDYPSAASGATHQ